MDKLFEVHMLNDDGKKKARHLALEFDNLLGKIIDLCGSDGREIAIVKTKLEEACFFTKKAMASKLENQEGI